MEKKRLTLLEANFREQTILIEKIYRKIATRKKNYSSNESVLVDLAYQLHNLYCAFEDLFQSVSDYFENHVIAQPAWHTELLKRMRMHINGIRPALISGSTFELLDELRGFRHVFRHAYTIELDAQKVKIVLQKALALKKIYKKDFARFLKQFK